MKTVRCAIYTRKSVEEGLEQEFNTLDAQRASCEAFVAAKRLEGWTCLPDRYDDGGFSGGNLKRPAFQRLMSDIRKGRVDMIVVYKIDRLSRSLVDWCQVLKELEDNHVSFSCVTQEFNTSTSMGRMCMNLLMTFAQFERELCSERVRDKMSATRRKGIWPGGIVPYGYRQVDHRLVPEPEEAENVRKIFRWYLELGSPKAVAARLNEKGILRFPERGVPWDTVKVSTCVRNCLYAGKVPLKGEMFDGVHKAIVSQELWDSVAAELRRRPGTAERPGRRTAEPSLLGGIVRCGHCGDALSYTWTLKRGSVKYAYYTCRKDMRRGVSTCPVKSVSAQIIEPLVEAEAIRFLKTPTMMRRIAEERNCSPYDIKLLLENADEFWGGLVPAARHRLLERIIDTVTVFKSSLSITFKTAGDEKLIEEFKNEHHDE